MWNTGISTVYNNSAVELNWDDLETDNAWFGSRAGQIAGGHNGKLAVIAPWCNNSHDVATKAIQFATDPGGAAFYVFQDQGDSLLYYVAAREVGSGLWDNRKRCGDGRSSYANLNIGVEGDDFVVSANAVA